MKLKERVAELEELTDYLYEAVWILKHPAKFKLTETVYINTTDYGDEFLNRLCKISDIPPPSKSKSRSDLMMRGWSYDLFIDDYGTLTGVREEYLSKEKPKK